MADADPLVLVIGATWFELTPLLSLLSAEGGPSGQSPPWPRALAGRIAGVPVVLAAGGIGKTNTAAAIATVCARAGVLDGGRAGSLRAGGGVRAVLQVGIGGAYPGAGGGPGLPLGAVAVASSEYDLDLGVGAYAAARTGGTEAGGERQGLESLGFAAVATDPPTYNLIACHPDLSLAVAAAIGCPLLPFATSDSVTADRATAERIAGGTGASVESMEGAAAAQVCLTLGLPFVELRAVSNEVGVRDKAAWRLPEAIAAAAAAGLRALPALHTV